MSICYILPVITILNVYHGGFAMDWNKDKSVMLSRVCIVVFAILLAAADIGAYWLSSFDYCLFLQRFCLDPAGEPLEAISQYTAGNAF